MKSKTLFRFSIPQCLPLRKLNLKKRQPVLKRTKLESALYLAGNALRKTLPSNLFKMPPEGQPWGTPLEGALAVPVKIPFIMWGQDPGPLTAAQWGAASWKLTDGKHSSSTHPPEGAAGFPRSISAHPAICCIAFLRQFPPAGGPVPTSSCSETQIPYTRSNAPPCPGDLPWLPWAGAEATPPHQAFSSQHSTYCSISQ